MEEKENTVIVVGDSQGSLQDRFAKFLSEKKRVMKNKNFISKERGVVDRNDPEFRRALRQKFIDRVKHYIGTPYGQRFHEPGSEIWNSPLFLDCCALVRQAVNDLRDEFGFSLGRWNQAYQYDVLPDEIPFEEMKPGDLIFYSATYYDPKKRKQLHDMVHVEVFIGEDTEEQTIGSRWFKGRVQRFDSYKFVSTNYYDIKYHYKSIEAWISGICKSYCPDHPWRDDRKNQWLPHRSIFAEEEEEQETTEHSVPERVCYIGKGNNLELVRDALVGRGWAVLPSNYGFSVDFKLKWVQTHGEVDFFRHIEGQQLMNHIPNIGQVFCTKKSLTECSRDESLLIPESYDLSDKSDLRKFMEETTEGVWIAKPLASNMGRGISLVQDLAEFKERQPRDMVVQKYIENPFLIEGHKFDIRFFVLIAKCQPLTVFGHKLCYARKSLNPFKLDCPDMLTHLTNAYQQKKHPEYPQRKEESIIGAQELDTILGGNLEGIQEQIFQVVAKLVQNKKQDLVLRAGCFELLGLDVMVDSNLKPHLIEINVNPAMWTDTSVLKKIFPKLVEDTIAVVLDEGQPDDYKLLYSE